MNLPPYPKYRPSGVEWIGDVPEHWEVKRLKYSASINDEVLAETTDPDLELSYVDIGSVHPVNGITSSEAMVFEDAPSRARRIVRDGDTIVSTVRTYLRTIAPIRNPVPHTIVSTGFAVVRPRSVSPKFMSFALSEPGFIEAIVARSVGVSYPAVNASEIGMLPIPIPETAEQQAIADFLDHETANLDALVAKQKTVIERLKEKRAALVTRTVTRGLPPAAACDIGLKPYSKFKPSAIEWLDEIPKHWRHQRISLLARSGAKTFTDGDWVELPYITTEGIRLLQTGNIGIGEYREQGFRYIDESSFDELRCTEVKPQDILICRLAEPVGRACLAPDFSCRMITSVDVCILKIADFMECRYVAYLFSSNAYLAFVESLCRGGTRDRISRSMLGAIRVPVPPYVEQRSISDLLDQKTEKIDDLIANIEIFIEHLQEYRSAIINAAVTGKIDVRVVERSVNKRS